MQSRTSLRLSSRCRTTTVFCTVKKNGKCSPHSRCLALVRSLGLRSLAVHLLDHWGNKAIEVRMTGNAIAFKLRGLASDSCQVHWKLCNRFVVRKDYQSVCSLTASINCCVFTRIIQSGRSSSEEGREHGASCDCMDPRQRRLVPGFVSRLTS